MMVYHRPEPRANPYVSFAFQPRVAASTRHLARQAASQNLMKHYLHHPQPLQVTMKLVASDEAGTLQVGQVGHELCQRDRGRFGQV